MEFNFLKHFKGLGHEKIDPFNSYQQGTGYFTSGHIGPQVQSRMEELAVKTELPRRAFFKSALGFAGAMVAVNQVTGMRFFDVSTAEAQELGALDEVREALKNRTGYVVDQHTHICTREEGYVEGVNTTPDGMWFVRLLDDLGKAMGLPNGTSDMNVENFGKLLLDGSDTDRSASARTTADAT